MIATGQRCGGNIRSGSLHPVSLNNLLRLLAGTSLVDPDTFGIGRSILMAKRGVLPKGRSQKKTLLMTVFRDPPDTLGSSFSGVMIGDVQTLQCYEPSGVVLETNE